MRAEECCSDVRAAADVGDSWASSDMVDCILSYAATELVDAMTDPYSDRGRDMLDRVRADARASKQMLLLSHLYAKTDAASLARLRHELLRPRYSVYELAAGASAAATVLAGVPNTQWMSSQAGRSRSCRVASMPLREDNLMIAHVFLCRRGRGCQGSAGQQLSERAL